MGYDGWVEFGGRELFNLSRTTQLCEVMGIDMLWTSSDDVSWIEAALGGSDYDDITEAPWYDPAYDASAEFAGFVPLGLAGLSDSSRAATTIEYVTDGGSSSKGRNSTLSIVANVALMASTDRGADYGRRWLSTFLARTGSDATCAGEELRYFRTRAEVGQPVPEVAHRRDVSLTRGVTVTRTRRVADCAVMLVVTFTLTANDPFEYGDAVPMFTALGGVPAGNRITDSGSLTITYSECPAYDYSPLDDPLYPSLVPPPTAPDFYPDGWDLLPGDAMKREWVRLTAIHPSLMDLVPVLTLTTAVAARMVRISIWPGDTPLASQCDPLWVGVISYLPTGFTFTIDGERKAAYAWDGVGESVRRTDGLVYSDGARPLQWASFDNPSGLLVTLDTKSDPSDFDGDGTLRVAMSLVPKND